MNRNAKGALAAGAAVVVLLGGAGTFALWSDSTANTPGNLTTGELKLTAVGTPSWKDVSTDTANVVGGTNVNPATDLLVPRDTWEYTATYSAVATGKNMKAAVTVNPGAAGTPPTGVTVTPTASVDGAAPSGTVSITPGSTHTVIVKVTVAFDDVNNKVSQASAVNVSDMSVQLNQVRP